MDHGLPLDNSTIYYKPLDDRIVLLELFGGISSGLAAVLQERIKVQHYVYIDIDDAARQMAKQHTWRLKTQFLELLATSAIISFFSTLFGDVFLLSEKDIQWLGHVDLVIASWPCQGISMAGKQNGL